MIFPSSFQDEILVSVLEKVSLDSQNEYPQGMKEHIFKPPNHIFLKMGLRVYAFMIMDKKTKPNTDAKMSYLQANHQLFKKNLYWHGMYTDPQEAGSFIVRYKFRGNI